MSLAHLACCLATLIGFIVLPLGQCQNGTSGFLQQGIKVADTGTIGPALHGWAVALAADGNTIAIGSPTDNNNTGATWVFARFGGTWTNQAKLTGNGSIGASQQGGSLALSADGSVLAVGGRHDDSDTGATWVFTRSGSQWQQKGKKLVGAGALGAAQQGCALALSSDGKTLAVGGCADNGTVGATWVFGRNGMRHSKLVGTGAVGGSLQGTSLSLSADGNSLAVGGGGDNGTAGAAWVFTRSAAGVWGQQGERLIGSGAVGPARQGESISLSPDGTVLAIGAPYDNNQVGAAWVFALSGHRWVQQGAKVAADSSYALSQGSSVALSSNGSTLALAGRAGGNATGAVWVYQRPDPDTAWIALANQLVAIDGAASSQQVVAMSADAQTVAVAAWSDNSVGAVWVYTCPGCKEGSPPLTAAPPSAQPPAPPTSPGLAGNSTKNVEGSNNGFVIASILGGLVPVVILIILAALSVWRKKTRQALAYGPSDEFAQSADMQSTPHVVLELPSPAPSPDKPRQMHGMASEIMSAAAKTSSEISMADTAWSSNIVNLSLQDTFPLSRMLEHAPHRSPRTDQASETSETRTLASSVPHTSDGLSELLNLPLLNPFCRARNACSDQVVAGREAPRSTASTLTYLTATVISLESIPANAAAVEVLQMQLDYVHAQNLEFFRLKLDDKSERRVGGQGIVQFGRHATYPKRRYAVKFYLDRKAFDTEVAHLRNPRLQHILPSIEDIASNTNNLICILGRPLPPLVVMEKGFSLEDWQRRKQVDFASAMHIIMHVFKRAADMHDADVVHCDLKPGNVIFYFARNEWTLIDFGGAAKKGATVPLTCTISYAAPEVVLALKRGERMMTADPALDVWSLGIVAYELLVGARVFGPCSRSLVEETMAGNQPLPWERRSDPESGRNVQRLGFMADGIMHMLARDPAQRATLREVLHTWHHFLKHDASLDAKHAK